MSLHSNNISVQTSPFHVDRQTGSIRRIPVSKADRWLKTGVWVYFFLLIFEGALRKWVLPGLATPLLVVRDPIGVWLLATAWRRHKLPFNIYMATMVIIGIISTFTAGLFGHGNLAVALFGARMLFLNFPLMFVIGKVFDRDDVVRLAKATLVLAVFMAILIFFQFNSPQSAWVNRGVGGDVAGAGYSGALGYFRPPGTFSFTTGVTLFFTFVAPLVCYFWLSSEKVNKWILIAATIALLASIPLSISRSLFFGVGVSFIFAILAVSRQPKYLMRIVGAVIFLLLALFILSKTSFLSTPTKVFTSRFENASEAEGGVKVALVDRYLGGMLTQLSGSAVIPFWGYGVGMGTNVGSMLLAGNITYLISEGEWGRLIGELGPMLGILAIFIRLAFCGTLTIAAYKKLVKGDLLPWLLLSNVLLVIPQGQWSQPTNLGFSTLIGGLIIAAFNKSTKVNKNVSVK